MILQIDIITDQRKFASITQYIFHLWHVVSSIEYDHTLAFVRLSNYDAIVIAKRIMRLLQLFARISMMVLPLLAESGYITVVWV